MKQSIFIVIPVLLLFTACSKEKISLKEGKNSSVIGTQILTQVMPGPGPIDTPDHGKELWFALTALTGTEGVHANGVSQAHYLEDGSFIATIQLNIERAPDGFFYEGWLYDKDSQKSESIGHLRTPFGDVRHQLKFLEVKDLRSYPVVQVSLEADDGNPSKSTIVAEGVLSERKR